MYKIFFEIVKQGIISIRNKTYSTYQGSRMIRRKNNRQTDIKCCSPWLGKEENVSL